MLERAWFDDLFVASSASPIHVSTLHGFPNEIESILEVSRGVAEGDSSTYQPRALICAGSWRKLLLNEANGLNLRLNSTGPTGRSIAVFSLTRELYVKFAALHTQVASQSAFAANLRASLRGAIGDLADAVSDMGGWSVDEARYSGGGFFASPGPQPHVTMHGDHGKFIGLHIDSWDRAPIFERHYAQNRICINLGAGPRAFLFTPVEAVDIVAMLQLRCAGGDDNNLTGRDDFVNRFLRHVADVPVIRISLNPGEAYIAPTENLIHDASSFASEDVTFTYRGRILSPVDRT